jgi:hypothetical protein
VGAGAGQGLEGRLRFEGTVDQHTAGGVGGFTARLSAFDDQDGGAAFADCNGEREADDAAADNDYIPSLHLGILTLAMVKSRGLAASLIGRGDDREREGA